MKALVIFNPTAGLKTKIDVEGIVREKLGNLGYQVDLIYLNNHFEDELDKFNLANINLVVAVGGDGTVKVAARTIIEKKISSLLSIIPYGSANVIAIAAGLPLNIRNSLKLLEEPKGDTIFILITEYPEMLLPTILSRVERLRFYHTEVQTFDQRQKKIIAELLEIIRQEMVLRFAYAKKLAEEPKRLKEILETWLGYFREILISAVHNHNKEYSLAKLSKILKLIQTTDFLIATTNVNARLALEILMLEL